MTGYTERPVTALDDLIAEQTMYPRRDPEHDDVPFRRDRSTHCRRCGGWNGRHAPMCDEQ
jgi:hypothetical protein